MSSRGGDQASREQEEEEDFYDCQDTLETPDRRGGPADEEGKEGGWEDLYIKTDRLQEEEQGDRLQEEEQGDRLQEEEQGDWLQEEEQGHRLQEEEQGHMLQDNSDSEIKENSKEVEFDDAYLREVEKELTEEEKEVPPSLGYLAVNLRSGARVKTVFLLFQSRRQQSLTLKEKGNSQFKAGGE